VREFSSYPPSLDDVPRLLEQHYDVIIIDLDAQPEYALELVESICANGTATVMVYSMKTDSELLVRCMRAGAREFLTLPFAQSTMAEALVRASARRPATRPPKKTGGRLLAFLGAKGGDGVTTLACNFAVSWPRSPAESTLLIDLDLPLGDAALNLGISAEYSTINALQNASRLDSSFLSKLLVKHSSGVSVLAAPGKFPQFDASDEAIDRLIAVARQDFDNVVIDMGSRLDLTGTSLFKDGSTIYLVIQASIAGLRNSNRLISQYFTTGVPKLEIVLNRFRASHAGRCRGPDYEGSHPAGAVEDSQRLCRRAADADHRHSAGAGRFAISRLIRQMARSACGLATRSGEEVRASVSRASAGAFRRRCPRPTRLSALLYGRAGWKRAATRGDLCEGPRWRMASAAGCAQSREISARDHGKNRKSRAQSHREIPTRDQGAESELCPKP
jgi:pilus assembly protein CpaE